MCRNVCSFPGLTASDARLSPLVLSHLLATLLCTLLGCYLHRIPRSLCIRFCIDDSHQRRGNIVVAVTWRLIIGAERRAFIVPHHMHHKVLHAIPFAGKHTTRTQRRQLLSLAHRNPTFHTFHNRLINIRR
ncbi:hypothetical protein V8E53_009265 [Lactarius tabidus]